MGPFASHILLYSKNHYETSKDKVADLKKLFSGITGCSPDTYTEADIYLSVFETVCLLAPTHIICFYAKELRIKSHPFTVRYWKEDESIKLSELTEHYLMILTNLQIDDIKSIKDWSDLPKPNLEFLPLNRGRYPDGVVHVS